MQVQWCHLKKATPFTKTIIQHVTLQRVITKENCISCIIASSKWTRLIMCVKYIYMGVIQQSVHETKIHDTNNRQKRLMQTCFDVDWSIIDAGVTIWDHVCMLVVDTSNTCSDTNVHLYDSLYFRMCVKTRLPHHHHNRFTALYSGTTWVSRCQKRTSGLYGARQD